MANHTASSDSGTEKPVSLDQALPSQDPEQAKEQLSPAHPRANLAEWRWKAMLAVVYLTAMINGYDVSNVANIQPRLYEAFHDIKLLTWIGLSYSMAYFAVLSLTRKIILCFNLRWTYLTFMLLFIAGAAIAGAAPSMSAIIVGRVIMGVAGAMCQQCNMTYVAIYATPTESPRLFGLMSAIWAVGVVVGGPVGSALAENHHATWRWAFYLNVPFVGLGWVIAIFSVPNYSLALPMPWWKRLSNVDPLGIFLHAASTSLFVIAMTFSGPIWPWGSVANITIWVLFGVIFLFWGVQQYFCLFTTPEQRAFPVHLLARRDLVPIWIASACAGAVYSITLYYTPLYFAFSKGYGPLPQTVRILPFILVFIVVVMLTGGVLPRLGRYSIIYVAGGALTLAGGAAMAATLSGKVSEAQVLGLEALIGVGLGMHFQHGAGLCSALNKDRNERVDSVIVFQFAQMGGIAVVLAFAGAIFQNVGFNVLKETLAGGDFTNDDIRQALAGLSSRVWQSSSPEVTRRGIEAVTKVISREFWIVASSGAVCLICGLLMKQEKLPGRS